MQRDSPLLGVSTSKIISREKNDCRRKRHRRITLGKARLVYERYGALHALVLMGSWCYCPVSLADLRYGWSGKLTTPAILRMRNRSLLRIMVSVTRWIVLLSLPAIVKCLDNGLALTPPMGWTTSERFGINTDCTNDPRNCIRESLIMDMIDHMATDGYRDAGYDLILITNSWAYSERDAHGLLQADPKRFPHGIKYLADYAHSKGLKLGLTAYFGTTTCDGYPGSLYYMITDANTFADWGIDMLQFDGCNGYVDYTNADTLYPAMGKALNATGRQIIYSCTWPYYTLSYDIDYNEIANNCNMWRDASVDDSWDSVTHAIERTTSASSAADGPGHWGYYGDLIIGDFSLSYDQLKTQMAFWAMLASPLFMSNDLRNISAKSKEILLNKEVIAVSQDPLGKPGFNCISENDFKVWCRDLSNGSVALVLFYTATEFSDREFSVSDMDECCTVNNLVYSARDLFVHRDLGTITTTFSARVNPSGVVMVKLTPQKTY